MEFNCSLVLEKANQMRYHVYVFACVLFCLCIFGSTKSSNAFDFSNSTALEAKEPSNVSVTFQESQSIQLVTPPQPRNTRGEFVCTRNRYVKNEQQVGEASWYGGVFHGRETASGEIFNKNAYTLAHLTLPMGTEVFVENPQNGIKIHARVTDCGPYIKGRIADLSAALAKKLKIWGPGKGRVVITVL